MAYILIVEDNEMNRDMLGRRLERRGYEIKFALDGQEGLDMMKSTKPDLVLMDMGLPVLDGWQATTQAKEDRSRTKRYTNNSFDSSCSRNRQTKSSCSWC